jgi:hypothetical protein
VVLIFGIVSLVFGLPTGLLTLAGLIWAITLFYLVVFARTGNRPHLFVSGYGIFIGTIVIELRKTILTQRSESVELGLAYVSGVVFFLFVLAYLVLTRKIKWRGRELFELAAEAVAEEGNGYTSRPRPVGKVEYSPEEMRAFAEFAARHLIALPYFTGKNITLVLIKMGDEFGRLLGLSDDYREATWVNLDDNGDVSVHIARNDYLDYRQPLAFDALCTSLGQIFIEFLELYSKGEGVRVIDRMDELQIPVFS